MFAAAADASPEALEALAALVTPDGVAQVAESAFLVPTLMGEQVGLHAVWILFAVLAGGSLLGFVGVLIAVPVAAVVAVVARWLLAEFRNGSLYRTGSPPPVDPPAP